MIVELASDKIFFLEIGTDHTTLAGRQGIASTNAMGSHTAAYSYTDHVNNTTEFCEQSYPLLLCKATAGLMTYLK